MNFLITVFRMRTPGMKMMQRRGVTWTALITNILIVAIFRVLTATLAVRSLDRFLDMHFFTNQGGTNAMT